MIRPGLLLDVEDLDQLDAVLVDTRLGLTGPTGRERYDAGHIPGAVGAPLTGNTDDLGRLLEPEVLCARFAGLGVADEQLVAAYCGSGVTACQTLLALRLAGLDGVLDPDSWSGWITDSERPVATGD